jgi:hypothetical protein
MKDGGCYAKYGPLGIIWKQVEERGLEWPDFCKAIKGLPAGQLWRHNQAGDLPGLGDDIDTALLGQLVFANSGKRGFTYTHSPVLKGPHAEKNRTAVATSNRCGFTINLSADNLAEADAFVELGIGPVVSVVSEATPEKFTTPAGRRGVLCPATTREGISCATCQLCSKQRSIIVGFRAHGNGEKKAEKIAGITTV